MEWKILIYYWLAAGFLMSGISTAGDKIDGKPIKAAEAFGALILGGVILPMLVSHYFIMGLAKLPRLLSKKKGA